MADTKLAEGRATEGPLTAVGPELAQLLVVGMWASTFVVTKAVLAEITPLAFIFARFALMTILAFAVLAARGRRAQWAIGRADLPRFLLVGICGYTLYQLGFVLGLDNTSPFSSSLLIAMVPFFTLVILAASGERARLGAWLGLGVALAGSCSSWPISRRRPARWSATCSVWAPRWHSPSTVCSIGG